MASVKIFQENNSTKKIYTSDYPVTKISEQRRGVSIESILPFRIRFTTIGIAGYGTTNAPPIGIAIIGLNNYIL